MGSARLVHGLLSLLTLMGAALALGACTSEEGGCKDDFDCDDTSVCRASTGSCEPFVCNTSHDCPSGLTCGDNHCD